MKMKKMKSLSRGVRKGFKRLNKGLKQLNKYKQTAAGLEKRKAITDAIQDYIDLLVEETGIPAGSSPMATGEIKPANVPETNTEAQGMSSRGVYLNEIGGPNT